MDAKTLNDRCAEPKVQNAVKSVVRSFCRRNGLDVEEVTGEAWLIALDLCKRFDGRGQLDAWVAWGLMRRLAKLVTENAAWKRRVCKPHSLSTLQYSVPARSCFDLTAFLWQISHDARAAVKLALAENSPVVVMYRTLRERGWSEQRVLRTFREIREALGYGDDIRT